MTPLFVWYHYFFIGTFLCYTICMMNILVFDSSNSSDRLKSICEASRSIPS